MPRETNPRCPKCGHICAVPCHCGNPKCETKHCECGNSFRPDDYTFLRQREADLLAENERLRAALKWTEDDPTIAGWYWWKPPAMDPEIIELKPDEHGNVVPSFINYLQCEAMVPAKWAGPLVPPPVQGVPDAD